jgi:hypothetical protein
MLVQQVKQTVDILPACLDFEVGGKLLATYLVVVGILDQLVLAELVLETAQLRVWLLHRLQRPFSRCLLTCFSSVQKDCIDATICERQRNYLVFCEGRLAGSRTTSLNALGTGQHRHNSWDRMGLY